MVLADLWRFSYLVQDVQQFFFSLSDPPLFFSLSSTIFLHSNISSYIIHSSVGFRITHTYIYIYIYIYIVPCIHIYQLRSIILPHLGSDSGVCVCVCVCVYVGGTTIGRHLRDTIVEHAPVGGDEQQNIAKHKYADSRQ
jgi:hypothetical protein